MTSRDTVDEVDATISTYLQERFPALRDLTDNTPLLSGGAVDSLGVLDLMMFLGERFGIELSDEDFDPDNIETPARLAAFIRRKQAP